MHSLERIVALLRAAIAMMLVRVSVSFQSVRLGRAYIVIIQCIVAQI